MSIEENELLISLTQQSNLLRRALHDLTGVWSDAASRTLHSMHLSPHLEHDEHMLQALETQTELHLKSNAWVDAADQHMAEADTAHQLLQGHLQYAQQQMVEAERKLQDSLALQQEVKAMFLKMQQIMQEDK